MITPDLEYKLKTFAQRKGVSESWVVRDALNQYVYGSTLKSKKGKKRNGFTALLEMAKHATDEGPSDLSTNDMYLYGPESEVEK